MVPEDSRDILRSRLQRRVSLPSWVSRSVDAEFDLASILLPNWSCGHTFCVKGIWYRNSTQKSAYASMRSKLRVFLSFPLHDWSCRGAGLREGWVSDTNKQIRHNIKFTKLLNHQMDNSWAVEYSWEFSAILLHQRQMCGTNSTWIRENSLQQRISGLMVCRTDELFQNRIVITYNALQIIFCNGCFYTPYSYVLYTLQIVYLYLSMYHNIT